MPFDVTFDNVMHAYWMKLLIPFPKKKKKKLINLKPKL